MFVRINKHCPHMSIIRVGTHFLKLKCKGTACNIEYIVNLKAIPVIGFEDSEKKISFGSWKLCHESEASYRENIQKLTQICENPYKVSASLPKGK